MNKKSNTVNIFWFRRDLRLDDNHALYEALSKQQPILPLFIFDTNILNQLPPTDARVHFIFNRLMEIKKTLQTKGSDLLIKHGKPADIFKELIQEYSILSVFANRDYEPYSRQRDTEIAALLQTQKIEFETYKDQVIFDHDDILKKDGKPYTVFTPYSKQWKMLFKSTTIKEFSLKNLDNLYKFNDNKPISLKDIGFEKATTTIPTYNLSIKMLENYQSDRDFPAKQGTSHLGIYFRFGIVSIRKVTLLAAKYSEVFLNELIWRNFYMDILWHYPHVEKQSFKPEYNRIAWKNDEAEFEKWCHGETGYPLVDAGMRELNATGYMHNRLRMITASFLTKHLLIDWRWGEAYFAKKLLDFELASNNGGWQWAAGTGCDAAPYFRIFNPEIQAKKFDYNEEYIREWVPEIGTISYFPPMVDHAFARKRAIDTYKKALQALY